MSMFWKNLRVAIIDQVFVERIIVKREKTKFSAVILFCKRSERKFSNFILKSNYSDWRKWKDKFENNTKIIFECIELKIQNRSSPLPPYPINIS